MPACVRCHDAHAETALYCPNCGGPTFRDSVKDALLGTLLGDRFQIQAVIGHGGSGTVFRAEHVALHRNVAVKVLHSELSHDALAIERFRREATTVTAIDNEHIVEIYDFGRTGDGRLYFAMELLDGESLDAVLARDRSLSANRAADILIQVGDALVEAHAIGYIHRDIRPRNIYLTTRHGQPNFVKLLDFGLAKLVESDAHAASTQLGMTFGDPRYISPEQARGDRMDRRGDIYQLGCVAYEMLTGAPPFIGERALDVVAKHVDDIPVPLPVRRPGVPLWLEAACAKMLAKEPENRFATAARMIEALQHGLETGGVMADVVLGRDTPEYDVAARGPAPAVGAPTFVVPAFDTLATDALATDTLATDTLATDALATDALATDAPATDAPAGDSQAGASARWYDEGERASMEAETVLGDCSTRMISFRISDTSRWDTVARRRWSGFVVLVGALLLVAGIAFAFTRVGTEPTKHEVAATSRDVAQPSVATPIKPPDAAPETPSVQRPLSTTATAKPAAKPVAPSRTNLPSLRTRIVTPQVSTPSPSSRADDVGARSSDGPADPYDDGDLAPPAGSRQERAAELANVGRQQLAADDAGGAARSLKTASALDPHNADAMVGMGELALRQGLFRDARIHLQRAAQLAPNSAVFTLLGEAYLYSAQFAPAAESFKKALQLDADNGRARAGYDEASARVPAPTDD